MALKPILNINSSYIEKLITNGESKDPLFPLEIGINPELELGEDKFDSTSIHITHN